MCFYYVVSRLGSACRERQGYKNKYLKTPHGICNHKSTGLLACHLYRVWDVQERCSNLVALFRSLPPWTQNPNFLFL